MALNESTARKYANQQANAYAVPKQKDAQVILLPKEKRNIDKQGYGKSGKNEASWTRSEKLLAIVILALVFVMSIYTIYTSNQVSRLNKEVQQVQAQISDIEISNQELEQNVKELSQYERVLKIAEEKGLSLNDQNVRNLQK